MVTSFEIIAFPMDVYIPPGDGLQNDTCIAAVDCVENALNLRVLILPLQAPNWLWCRKNINCDAGKLCCLSPSVPTVQVSCEATARRNNLTLLKGINIVLTLHLYSNGQWLP